MKITLSKKQWEFIGQKTGWIKTAQKYLVIDDEFNRENYPDLIGKVLDSPPAYAKVELFFLPEETVSIFDFMKDWQNEGYGIALISPDGKIVDPYVDSSDYPDMFLNKSGDGAKVMSGKYKDYWIKFHSGQFEGNIGQDFSEAKSKA